MIRVFIGDDRVAARKEIGRWMGTRDYEVIEGEELQPEDLPNIFRGASLFETGERKILLRDALKSPAGEFLADYADTKHKVAIMETKLDKRLEAWKKLSKVAKVSKFELDDVDKKKMFGVFRMAKKNGAQAIKVLEEIRAGLEPKAFIGAMASTALKDYQEKGGQREKRILREMAKLDVEIGKGQAGDKSPDKPWLLTEGFLLRLSKM